MECLEANLQSLSRARTVQVGIKYLGRFLIRVILIGDSRGRIPPFHSQARHLDDQELDSIFPLLFSNYIKNMDLAVSKVVKAKHSF